MGADQGGGQFQPQGQMGQQQQGGQNPFTPQGQSVPPGSIPGRGGQQNWGATDPMFMGQGQQPGMNGMPQNPGMQGGGSGGMRGGGIKPPQQPQGYQSYGPTGRISNPQQNQNPFAPQDGGGFGLGGGQVPYNQGVSQGVPGMRGQQMSQMGLGGGPQQQQQPSPWQQQGLRQPGQQGAS